MRVTTLDDGKYTIENDNGTLNFKRHGEAWPAADDLRYTKIVSVMVHRIEELEDALARLEASAVKAPEEQHDGR